MKRLQGVVKASETFEQRLRGPGNLPSRPGNLPSGAGNLPSTLKKLKTGETVFFKDVLCEINVFTSPRGVAESGRRWQEGG